MRSTKEIIEQIKREIESDIAAGVIPANVATFSELHDHVDANEYGDLTTKNSGLSFDKINVIQGAVDEWLRSRHTNEKR